MTNPYRAKGVPFKPWWVIDYYVGHRIVHGRYWFAWQARLARVGLLTVEYGTDQDRCGDPRG